MSNCYICNKKVMKGITLSDGDVIHSSCLENLEEKAFSLKSKIQEIEEYQSIFEGEIRRRKSLGFKIKSILLKPNIDENTLVDSISEAESKINEFSSELSDVNELLEEIYDYFLNYPPDWDERKDKVIHRDGLQCSSCGSSTDLHLHHIKPLSKGGDNHLSNLILLCEGCHSKEHGGKDFLYNSEDESTAFSKRVTNIQLAISEGRRVSFGYKKPGERKYTKRTIKPIEMVNIAHDRDDGYTLCVRGFCELRQAKRTFAIKRMWGLKII